MALTNTMSDNTGAYKRNVARWSDPNPTIIPESGRYHLYVALACPWACGALQMLKMRGLVGKVGYSVVHPTWQRTRSDDPSDKHHGWAFKNPGDPPVSNPAGNGSIECDGALIPDPVMNAAFVRDLYVKAGDETGPFTTPLLYDRKTDTIVSNESMVILKVLHDEFGELAGKFDTLCPNLYPESPQKEMLEDLNSALIYPKINNGVYRSGFAKAQGPYDAAVKELFEALDTVEEMLGKKRYIGGDKLSWLDIRLFNTLIRFDPVYNCYFKCNLKRLQDYPNLLGYTRDVYQTFEPIRECINVKHIKEHYYTSHSEFNYFGVISASDGPDMNVPHGRERM